jgi:hypothetical protein
MVLENIMKKQTSILNFMKLRSGTIVLLVLLATMSCGKGSSTGGAGIVVTPPPPPPPPVVTPLLSIPAGWRYSATLSSAYPEGMQVYSIDSTWDGQKLKAFAVLWDSKNKNIEMKPVLSATAKKPSAFFSSELGVVLACINGGFFGGNQSYSTVKYSNEILSPNIKAVNRNFNGSSTAYFPTRAAVGLSSSGVPSATWIYHDGPTNEIMYSYPAPSPNAEGKEPQPVPTASFPAGGTVWNVTTSIGGSPMLIHNNAIKITDKEELISINNTTSRPRSAIGFNSNGIMMLLAVEGDNAVAGYSGLNLLQLANLMQTFGLSHAMNLDGGGSTSLILNNQPTVRPGDGGVERPVVSAIILKRK